MELTYEQCRERKNMLNNLNSEVAKILKRDKVNIDIDVEANFKTTFGNCEQRLGLDGKTIVYTKIRISKYLSDKKSLQNTMLHELCHAYCSIRAGHGPEWQNLAKTIGDAYGIKIQRLATEEETKNAMPDKPIYGKLRCTKCGHIYNLYTRRGAYKTRGVGYICGRKINGHKCGGTFEFIKTDN